jgi:hypothetical protein
LTPAAADEYHPPWSAATSTGVDATGLERHR